MGRKIEYQRVGIDGAYVTLAQDGDGKNASISGYQFPAASWSPQRSPLYYDQLGAAAAPFTQNTGNASLKTGFVVMRTFDTLALAAADLSAEAALLMVFVQNFNLRITDEATVYRVLNCAITEWMPEPDHNRTTVVKYGFEGGSYAAGA